PPLGALPGEFAAWAESMRVLAGHPNVAVKFSGLVTRAAGVRWHAHDVRPVAEILLTAFGEDRVLFGADWPVCLLSAFYGHVAATARKALSGADPSRIFGGNARRWYRLPLSGSCVPRRGIRGTTGALSDFQVQADLGARGNLNCEPGSVAGE